MTENAALPASIDEATECESEIALAAMGLPMSDGFRLLLRRLSAGTAPPFEPPVPNAETVEAMKAARRGEVVAACKPSNLFARLIKGR